jgi:hypothetical protein
LVAKVDLRGQRQTRAVLFGSVAVSNPATHSDATVGLTGEAYRAAHIASAS